MFFVAEPIFLSGKLIRSEFIIVEGIDLIFENVSPKHLDHTIALTSTQQYLKQFSTAQDLEIEFGVVADFKSIKPIVYKTIFYQNNTISPLSPPPKLS